MVSRNSTSTVALLALVAGGFAVGAPVAVAGDKIEFSVASPLLAVPKPERVITQNPATAIRESLSKHEVQGSDFSYVPSATIVIPAPKSRDHFGWTAPFQENQEQDDQSPGLDLFSPRTASTHTNSSGMSNDKNPDFYKDSAFSKDGNWVKSDRDTTRFGADTLVKDGGRGEDRLSNRFEEKEKTAADWFRSLESFGPKSRERTRETAMEPRKEDFGSSDFYHQPLGGLTQPNPYAPTDPLHASAYAPVNSGSDWLSDSMRGQSQDQVQAQPLLARPWEEIPTVAHPLPPTHSEQNFSVQTQAPSRPVRLDFPKRPGDLFQ
jgi:hypothetical protein